MGDRPDKQSRKAAVNRWMAEQHAIARAALPLPDDQMQALFDMLDAALPQQGGDHTLRLTRGWLSVKELPVESVVEWLRANDGYCDCEALANAEEAWQAATGRL